MEAKPFEVGDTSSTGGGGGEELALCDQNQGSRRTKDFFFWRNEHLDMQPLPAFKKVQPRKKGFSIGGC